MPFLAGLTATVIDPLVKIFPETVPASLSYTSEVARGEVASWEVVLRSDVGVRKLTIKVGEMRSESGVDLGRPRIRAIGYVPVAGTIPTPPKLHLAPVPGPFPDPLLTDLPRSLAANRTQAFWIDLPVGAKAKAGEYTAAVHVSAPDTPGETLFLRAKVFPVTVGKSRYGFTNWYVPPPGDPWDAKSPFWKELAVYARDMAAHRMDMAMVSPLSTVRVKSDGTFDFSVFNRWIDVFRRAGVIGRIEGGHLAGRVGNFSSAFQPSILEVKDGKTVVRSVAADSPEAAAFYSRFLPTLVQDLKKHGWLGIYRQHIGDEPIDANADSYAAIRELVRRYAPELKVMDANYTTHLAGSMDLWVPELQHFGKDYDFYRRRQAKGEELWFYTCAVPQGEYANRFMEQPLVETRLLQWIAFKYGATGYLHWGWNYWGMMGTSPFEKTVYDPPDGGFLPAGDCFIVYPGKDGQILDSIRWETVRDGIADYELLSMLADQDPAAAQALAARLVHGFASYDLDPSDFRAVRRELLERLSPPVSSHRSRDGVSEAPSE